MNQTTGLALPPASWVDLLFPLFAFLCIVVLPSLTAVWVIVKIVTEKAPSDQT
ncbi:MAG: hypothetical protein AAF471_02220 [Myxococcota bacterium]